MKRTICCSKPVQRRNNKIQSSASSSPRGKVWKYSIRSTSSFAENKGSLKDRQALASTYSHQSLSRNASRTSSKFSFHGTQQPMSARFYSSLEVQALIAGEFKNLLAERHPLWQKQKRARRYLKTIQFLGIDLDAQMYTIIIHGMNAFKLWAEVEQTLHEMKSNNVPLEPDTFHIAINASSKQGNMERAMQLLEEMESKHFKPDLQTYTTLLIGFVLKSEMKKAVAVLDEMISKGLYPDRVVYTALIQGYVEMGNIQHAEEIMKRMQDHGFQINTEVYNKVMWGYFNRADDKQVQAKLDDMQAAGIRANANTYNIFLKQALTQQRRIAPEILDKMKEEGIMPTAETYKIIIEGLRREGDYQALRNLLLRMNREGELVSSLLASVIRRLVQEGRLKEAEQMWNLTRGEGITQRWDEHVTMMNTVLMGYWKHEGAEGAEAFVEQMQKQQLFDSASYNVMLSNYVRKGDQAMVEKWMEKITNAGFQLDNSTLSVFQHSLSLKIKREVEEVRKVQPPITQQPADDPILQFFRDNLGAK